MSVTSGSYVLFYVSYTGARETFTFTLHCDICETEGIPQTVELGGGISSVTQPIYIISPAGSSGEVRLQVRGLPGTPVAGLETNAWAWVTVTGSSSGGPSYAATVTPEQPSVTVTPNSYTQQTFTIRNIGNASSAYQLTPSCIWNNLPAPCNVSPTTTPMVGASAFGGPPTTATVTMAVGGPGRGGITLTAVSTQNGQRAGSGSVGLNTPNTLVVTPDNGSQTLAAGSSGTVPFTISYSGLSTESFNLTLAPCAAPLTCGQPQYGGSPVSSVLVSNSAPATVQVPVTLAAGAASSSLVRLTVTAANVSGLSDDGTVTVAPAAGPPPPPPPPGTGSVAVTPDTGRVFANATTTFVRDSIAFWVRNGAAAGTGGVSYQLALGCVGAAAACEIAGGTMSPAVAPQDSQRVFVRFTPAAGMPGDSGRVTLDASGGGATDRGTVGVVAARLLETAAHNPETTLERDACVTVGVSRAAAYECGDLRVVHPLPSVTTRGRTRTPTLLYNSAHARPFPVVRADVALRPGVTQTAPVTVTLHVAGVERDRRVFNNPTYEWRQVQGGDPPGTPRRITLGFDATDVLATGLYPYVVTVDYGGGARWSTAGELVVVNRSQSAFGAGWWLAGYERLYKVDGTGLSDATRLLWVGGDGSTRVFRRDGVTDVYRVERAYDRPESLTRYNGTAPSFARWLPGGGEIAQARFDYEGHHVYTTDRLGQVTNFEHHSGGPPRDAEGRYRMAGLRVPPAGNALHYAFAYGAGNGASLSGVTLRNSSTGQVFHSVAVTAPGGAVATITDRDGRVVSFGYGADGTPAKLITSRTDKRPMLQRFRYDVALRLTSTSVTVSNAVAGGGPQEIVHRFCAAEVRGRAGVLCDPGPSEPRFVATRWDGPRDDAAPNDLTYFAVDRFGAPTRVQDALDSATTIERADGHFPGLATRVIDAVGLVTQAFYDTSGLADSVRTVNPYGPKANGQDSVATTKYTWNSRWRAALTVTTPEGVVTETDYDGSGNRRWQQTGGPTRRVDFTYTPNGAGAGLLASVLQPSGVGGRAPQVMRYDVLGNVDSVAGPGDALTKYRRDGLGRVYETQTRITGETYQVNTLDYDAMDRVVYDSTFGPALSGAGAQSVVVRRSYTAEGEDSVLTRGSVPNSANIGPISTEWHYDALGRRVYEIAPDGRRDRWMYDQAGNVVRDSTRRGHIVMMRYDAVNRLRARVRPEVVYAARRSGIPTHPNLNNSDTVPYPRYPTRDSSYVIAAATDTMAYDAQGRVIYAGGPDARVRRRYWPNGLLREEVQQVRTTDGSPTDNAAFDLHTYTQRYRYDLDSRRSWFVHATAALTPSGQADSVGYGYDLGTGELARITDLALEDGSRTAYDFAYTTRGELRQLSAPGVLARPLGYFADGTLAGDTLTGLGAGTGLVFRRATFTYDARGKVLTSANNAARKQETFSASYTGLGHVRNSTSNESRVEPDGVTLTYSASETPVHDPLGNLLSSMTSTSLTGRPSYQTFSEPTKPTSTFIHQATTGRLVRATRSGATDTTIYDASGNVAFVMTLGDGSSGRFEDRASYYAADNTLRAADSRSLTFAGDADRPYYERAFEEYRYDALGRRVWVRTRRGCINQPAGEPLGACRISTVRRTVWDGDAELYEIQMPGDSGRPAAHLEADVTPPNETAQGGSTTPNTTSGRFFDPNPFFGRVAYTYGLGIDRPLAVTRIAYADTSEWRRRIAWPAFRVLPHWDYRGQPDLGSFSDGAVRKCMAGETVIAFGGPLPRCVRVDWPLGWFPYNRARYRPFAWVGTLVEDKRDGAGTLYRRNRVYDPGTGRFTQEDPIGLAGGINLYGFAGADPVNLADPFGLCPPVRSCLALAGAAAAVDGPLPVGDVVAAGLLGTAAWLAVKAATSDAAIPQAAEGARRREDPSVYHRLESPTQTPADAAAQQASGELWGRGYRDSGVPYVQAYTGSLPQGRRGIEFTTPVVPSPYSVPGNPQWIPGTPGVRVENGYAKIPIVVTKNTQTPR